MTDVYTQVVNTPIGKVVTRRVGLPQPARLRRDGQGRSDIASPVLLGGAPGGRLDDQLAALLGDAGAQLLRSVGEGAAQAGPEALVFDATGICDVEQLQELQAFFSASIRALASCGRVVVLGGPPATARTPSERIAQRALEGFTRSLGKELRRGATAQLVYVAPGGEGQLASTLRFLLSPRSAYVSGQVIVVGPADTPAQIDWKHPQQGKVALVTGASRGIGASIAATLARDGAHVVGLDVPALAEDLRALTDRLGGSALCLDITAEDAPQQIAAHLRETHGGVDVVVHNAGITRDKTIGRMDRERWSTVIGVNLDAPQRITDALTQADAGRGAASRRTDRLRVVDQRHRGQRRADQLRDLEGRRDRPRRRLRAAAGGQAGDDQRCRAGVHRDPDDGQDALRAARGGTAHELAVAGRPAGRRGRGDRLAGLAGFGRRQRKRRSRVRTEPAGGIERCLRRESSQQQPGSLDMLVRAALPMIPGASRLPFVAGGGDEVPDTVLSLTGVRLDPDRLALYASVCGFSRADALPATAPHLLAFPLHMALMTAGSFPVAPIGLVHLANTITLHRAIGTGERLDVSVHATALQPHPRGRTFTLVSEARAGGELVWEEHSTMLRREPGGGRSDDRQISRPVAGGL